VTAGYAPPPEFTDPPASPAGALTEAVVDSRAERGSFRVIVYSPAGYRRDGEYPVAVFLSARTGPLARVLDWLIARQAIEPVVAVFVDPTVRGDDARAGSPWAPAFLDDELPAWLASRYAVTRSAGRRGVIGISFGAKDALEAALDKGGATGAAPTLQHDGGGFSLLGLLIPGRRITRADIEAIAGREGRRLHAAILAGQYDQANVATARGLRETLARAGHQVDYTEVPEGHNPATWIYHLRVVLVGLFAPGPASTTPGR